MKSSNGSKIQLLITAGILIEHFCAL